MRGIRRAPRRTITKDCAVAAQGLRSFDCDGSEKSANGLRARLLNVVLRPLSENRCPIPTEVPCGHFGTAFQ